MPSVPEQLADGAERFVEATKVSVGAAAGATDRVITAGAAVGVEFTRTAVGVSVAHLTRVGRMVLRAWKFFERLSNPPWTPTKVLAWIAIFLFVAVVTVLAYQFKYGILTLPIVEAAGLRFVDWLSGAGALGLFGFTVFGTLFFMIIPTEPFFFLIIAGGTPLWAAILAAGFGSTLGSCLNYWFGNRLRVSAGKKQPGEERQLGKWGKRAHSKSGTLLLFLASALPLPELVALAYGLVDYPFKRFVLVALPGRMVKWGWIAAAYLLFQFSL